METREPHPSDCADGEWHFVAGSSGCRRPSAAACSCRGGGSSRSFARATLPPPGRDDERFDATQAGLQDAAFAILALRAGLPLLWRLEGP